MLTHRLKRTNHDHSNRPRAADHLQDFEQYADPLSRISHANLFDSGIVSGLHVTGTIGSQTLQVAAGVAIDPSGRMVVLHERGDIGNNPFAPSPQNEFVDVPVALSTEDLSGELYVTIQFSEVLDRPSGSSDAGDFEQIPWVRLQDSSVYDPASGALILATLTLNEASAITAVHGQDRKMLESQLGNLRLQRGVATVVPGDEFNSAEATTIALDGETGTIFAEGEALIGGNMTIGGMLKLPEGVEIREISADSALTNNSDQAVPTQAAVKSYIDSLLVGSVTAFATQTPPAGWLECNGLAISRNQYAALFARIGTRFGTGNGATTFNLPDLRGQFVRGWAHGSSADPDRAVRLDKTGRQRVGDIVGSYQPHVIGQHAHSFRGTRQSTQIALGSHTHSSDDSASWSRTQPTDTSHWYVSFINSLSWKGDIEYIKAKWFYVDFFRGNVSNANLRHSHLFTPNGSVLPFGGNETRPRNVSLMYCIKF